MSLMALGERIRAINHANGWNVFYAEQWHDPYKIPAILALIHSEVSEALEAFRRRDQDTFREEMADIVIRVLDCVTVITDNFDQDVMDKLAVNEQRGYRHGNKVV